jgi:hypothetical protein
MSRPTLARLLNSRETAAAASTTMGAVKVSFADPYHMARTTIEPETAHGDAKCADCCVLNIIERPHSPPMSSVKNCLQNADVYTHNLDRGCGSRGTMPTAATVSHPYWPRQARLNYA